MNVFLIHRATNNVSSKDSCQSHGNAFCQNHPKILTGVACKKKVKQYADLIAYWTVKGPVIPEARRRKLGQSQRDSFVFLDFFLDRSNGVDYGLIWNTT